MKSTYIYTGLTDFSIEQIAESGQTFRWNKDINGGYTGVVFGKVINITQYNDKITIIGSSKEEFEKIWKEYFDLNRNYNRIIKEFSKKDLYLAEATKLGWGIRILNQDLWEMIVSFIISGNNNIPRIKKAIEVISRKYGEFIENFNGVDYYSFPTPEQLSLASVADLRALGVGYRDKYIYKTTQLIINSEVILDNILKDNTDLAREELKKLVGVGDKVADCILLFSCKKSDAFPVDTWVKKILKEFYNFEEKNPSKVKKFALDYFGNECGIAQQYLFYYIREKSKKEDVWLKN